MLFGLVSGVLLLLLSGEKALLLGVLLVVGVVLVVLVVVLVLVAVPPIAGGQSALERWRWRLQPPWGQRRGRGRRAQAEKRLRVESSVLWGEPGAPRVA